MSGFCTLGQSEGWRVSVRALLISTVSDGNAPATMITAHEVESKSGSAVLSEGVVFNAAHRDELLRLLTTPKRPALRPEPMMPHNVIDVRGSRLVWWIMGRTRPLYFAFGSNQARVVAPWPSLVLEASDRGLRVAALRGNRRPRASTPLCYAPLMNVGRDSLMCAGSASLPKGRSFADMDAWQAALFDTNFSHVNHERTLNSDEAVGSGEHYQFWSQLQREKATAFPVERLVPSGQRLEQWLSR